MIKIVKKNNFLTNEIISSTASTLDYRNGYFVNFETGRGDLTSEFNIQEFLSNPINSIIVNAFLDYIKNNFENQQIIEIKDDNKKLSDAFNHYYNFALLGVDINSDFLPQSSEITSIMSYNNNLFFTNGNRDLTTQNTLRYINTGDSYYININLFKNFEILSQIPFELTSSINDGFQIEKEVIFLDNAFLSGQTINNRIVNFTASQKQLVNGFVNLNIQDSPFNDYSNSGLDSVVKTFSGNPVFQIEAEISGNISQTESIYPVGITDIIQGGNQTFTFKTVNSLKSISQVLVNNVKVDYDRLNNLSKNIAGSYTFSSVTKNQSIIVFFV